MVAVAEPVLKREAHPKGNDEALKRAASRVIYMFASRFLSPVPASRFGAVSSQLVLGSTVGDL